MDSDIEVINRARSLSGYTDNRTFDDSDVQEVIEIAKDQIRARYNRPNYTFYQTTPVNTFRADQALFWWTCLGLKVRAGEIGAPDMTLSELEQAATEEQYAFWLSNLRQNLINGAPEEQKGMASTQIERADRSYEYDVPDLGGE